MEVEQIANRLVELCRQGKYMEAQNELYVNQAVSIEPEGSFWQSAEGIEALNGKIEQWNNMVVEVHSMEVSDPHIAGNFFSVVMANDITTGETGCISGSEIAVYEVGNGKIVREQFFYSMPG